MATTRSNVIGCMNSLTVENSLYVPRLTWCKNAVYKERLLFPIDAHVSVFCQQFTLLSEYESNSGLSELLA